MNSNSTLQDNFWYKMVHYEFYAIVDEYETAMTNIDNDSINEMTNTNSHSFDFGYKSSCQSNYGHNAIRFGYKISDEAKKLNSHRQYWK